MIGRPKQWRVRVRNAKRMFRGAFYIDPPITKKIFPQIKLMPHQEKARTFFMDRAIINEPVTVRIIRSKDFGKAKLGEQ